MISISLRPTCRNASTGSSLRGHEFLMGPGFRLTYGGLKGSFDFSLHPTYLVDSNPLSSSLAQYSTDVDRGAPKLDYLLGPPKGGPNGAEPGHRMT